MKGTVGQKYYVTSIPLLDLYSMCVLSIQSLYLIHSTTILCDTFISGDVSSGSSKIPS